MPVSAYPVSGPANGISAASPTRYATLVYDATFASRTPVGGYAGTNEASIESREGAHPPGAALGKGTTKAPVTNEGHLRVKALAVPRDEKRVVLAVTPDPVSIVTPEEIPTGSNRVPASARTPSAALSTRYGIIDRGCAPYRCEPVALIRSTRRGTYLAGARPSRGGGVGHDVATRPIRAAAETT